MLFDSNGGIVLGELDQDRCLCSSKRKRQKEISSPLSPSPPAAVNDELETKREQRRTKLVFNSVINYNAIVNRNCVREIVFVTSTHFIISLYHWFRSWWIWFVFCEPIPRTRRRRRRGRITISIRFNYE